MRKVLRILGVIMLVEGISGTIDQIAIQPFLGVVLNAFNRFVVERLEVLEGYEIFSNLILAVLGLVLIVAAARTEFSHGRS